MKAVLKDTLYGRMLKEIAEAKRNDKEVDYFLLTKEEESELYKQHRLDSMFDTFDPNKDYVHDTVRFIELEDKTAKFPKQVWYRFCPSPYKFQGIDLFVVPERFIR